MISYQDGIYCQNEAISIPITDPGFTRSHVGYEAVCVYEGQLFDFESHFRRLCFSLKELGIKPLKIDLKKICENLIKKNHKQHCLLRIYRTPGIDQNGALYILSEKITIIENVPAKICTMPNFRTHPLIKSTHYAPAIAACQKAHDDGFDEVLFVSDTGNLLELSYSNFFAIKGKELLTPDAGILPGVTRRHILEIAPRVGLKAVCRPLNMRELQTFDEVFHTNTTKEVMPISQINDFIYPNHFQTKALHNAFRAFIENKRTVNKA